jgi:tetratricopeptide (TPR) repeat protein
MRHFTYVILLVCLLEGCAMPIEQKNAASYYDRGLESELAGNYPLAESNYEKALISARVGHSPDAGISAAAYSLGRMKGYLCKYDEAEKLLTESLTLEKQVTGLVSRNTAKRLFELARFYSDRGYFASSVPYFESGIPAAEKQGVQTSDPIAFAEVLEEFAIALDNTGKASQAKSAKNQANSLRAEFAGRVAKYQPIRYNRTCDK